MDYEKAYKESFGAAQCLHEAGDTTTKKQMERLFPQLAESEDERIRKWILEKMQGYASSGIPCSDEIKMADKAIDYLEKQKEQKLESCDCSRDEESYINGIHHVLMNPEAYGLIKQKLAGQLGGTFTSYDMAKTFTEGQNYVIAHPEKYGLQKQIELSEEDEVMLKEIVSFFKDGSVKLQHDLDLYAAFLEKRLKSLCPKPHWKPSEEQMKALENVIKCELSAGLHTRANILQTLQNELKKL